MDLKINLSGIESASENIQTKRIVPGVHTLTISKIEVVSSNSGNNGLRVEFTNEELGASFNETFWLSPKALPRLQYLIEKFDGEKHDGDITVSSLNAKLIGKTRTCIVDGREALSNPVPQEDGTVKVYTNIYPQLRFAGFVGDNFKDEDAYIERLKPAADSGALGGSSEAPSDVPF